MNINESMKILEDLKQVVNLCFVKSKSYCSCDGENFLSIDTFIILESDYPAIQQMDKEIDLILSKYKKLEESIDITNVFIKYIIVSTLVIME